MNNFEKIKNMTVEEMADFITDLTNGCEYGCLYCKNYIDGECSKNSELYDYIKGCKEWLESEVLSDETS